MIFKKYKLISDGVGVVEANNPNPKNRQKH